MKDKKRILIVGGVAGGASCAARLRRLDENAEIHLFERGPYISFANCGLPYYVGGIIPSDKDLLVADADLFRARFAVDVHPMTEVVSIDRTAKTAVVRSVETGVSRVEPYDVLVLSPGAVPVKPPLPGIDLPGIFTVRNIPDSRAIREWIEAHGVRKAVVVGGGFIGLEMAENLLHRGIAVTIVEMLDQVMPPLDREIADVVATHLCKRGMSLALGDGVAGFEQTPEGSLVVKTASGKSHEAQLVILAIGVRPDTTLAKAAGLGLGPRGGIATDPSMRTSDPHIFAVGDAVEVRDWVSGQPTLIPLAGPANRQGRIAADVICGRNSRFRGVQGTAICGVCGLQVASTGASEKALVRSGDTDFEKVYVHPNNHSGYYPGAKQMTLKLIFRRSDGTILGAQGIGEEGVDRRIDVIAMAIQKRGTVFDLEEAELCYAPQFGGAKDPVNFAGMVAADVLRGDMPLVHWDEPAGPETLLLDVRSPEEFATGHPQDALNIPLDKLREDIGSVPRDKDLRAYCAVGLRGYVAARILLQHGIPARNLSGGWLTAQRGIPNGQTNQKSG
jgi:NADPH-dependent 2,4-dienoyl-CoA reductase/sulfur reductase-like enzyme/rhodanese-related sulfurtransferase